MPPLRLLRIYHPELFKELHPTLNKHINLDKLGSGHINVIWKCPNDLCGHHVYKTTVARRIFGVGCIYCSHNKTCECDSLFRLRPDIMNIWNEKKNNKIGLDPKELGVKSNKKAYFYCDKAECKHHKWKAKIADVTRRTKRKNKTKGIGCPYCSGHKICKCDSISTLYPELMKEWDYEQNGNLDPIKIGHGCNEYVYWTCSKAECRHHKWRTKISNA